MSDQELPFDVFDIDAPPREFDEYRIVQLIGEGAMGKVYLAQNTLLHREVAIKLINQPNALRRERFVIEARAAARLQHPNIVSIYRIGEINGQPYIVEEYVRGQILAHLRKPMPWQKVLELGIPLARGLAAAHRRGVLHRDIKPENVIVSDSGEPKLADFGLAKLMDEAEPEHELLSRRRTDIPTLEEDSDQLLDGTNGASLTEDGAILGTPYYMAPEIWRGEAATPCSDVYGFGAMIYELCAGHVPLHDVRPRDLQYAVEVRDAPPLASQVSDIDSRLAAIIDRCLARKADERYASGEAVLDALAELDSSNRAAPLPAGSPYRGLMAFEAEHRALFFGRDLDIRDVIERLRTESVVLIAGESGVGKSSLARAGVLPAVVDSGLGDGRAWQACTLVPGAHPLSTLTAKLAHTTGIDEQLLAQELVDDGAMASQRLRNQQGTDRGLIIFVDQLEELITLSDPDELAATSEALASLALRTPGARLLATVRADKLAEIAKLPGLGTLIERGLYILRPLSVDDVREAVVGPARVKGVHFESDALVTTLVESAMVAKGGLPLLQFALAQLWEARDRENDLITDSALDELGGVEGALSRHADGVLEALLPKTRAAARRILLQLVTVHGTRARHTDTALIHDDPSRRAALRALVDGRLVVVREVDGAAACELAHEALVKDWTTLREWLEEEGSARIIKERLAVAAHEWHQMGRPRDALWGGLRLREAAELDRDDLSRVEAEFVESSLGEYIRGRRTRRIVVASAFLALVTVLAVVLFLNRRANIERDRAERARERATAYAAKAQTQLHKHYIRQGRQALLDGDPLRAFPYLLEVLRSGDDNPAIRFMLARATQALDGELLVLPAHDGVVSWAAISPSGSPIATAGFDKTVKLWNPGSGERLHTLEHEDRVWMLDFSPDGAHVASCSWDKTVRVWNVADGTEVWLGKHEDRVTWVGYTPDGSKITTTSRDQTVKVWDAKTGELLKTMVGHEDVVSAGEHVPRSDLLVTGSEDRTARIWNLATGELMTTTESHDDWVRDVAVSPDGSLVATASWDGEARVSPVGGGKALVLSGHVKYLTDIGFSPDGARLVTASDDGLAIVWDAKSGERVFDFEGHAQGLTVAAYSPDGSRILTASRDGTARIWDATTGLLKWTYIGHHEGIWMARFDATGNRVITAGFDGTVRLWNARQSKHALVLGDHERMLRSAAFSPDGDHIATIQTHGAVHIWDRSGKLINSFEAGSRRLRVSWNPDGVHLITSWGDTSAGEPDLRAIGAAVWDSRSGREISTITGHSRELLSATYSRRGDHVVTASADKTAKIWDARTGALVATIVGHDDVVTHAELDPRSTRVLTASQDATARIWDAKTAEELALLEGHTQRVITARFSADGTRVVTAAEDQSVRIWTDTGQPISVLEGLTSVIGANFSRSGSLVLVALKDGRAQVWDVATGQLLWSIDAHLGIPRRGDVDIFWPVELSPDYKHLLTLSGNTAALWDVGYDHRSIEALSAFAACRVGYTIDRSEELKRMTIDYEKCRGNRATAGPPQLRRD